ncbi:hypothetical protein PR048_015148 [Dryococelus australis]|uniref:Uncharacterized protein n=1 Tax=Dryococelus australis TaxID=614101 RepID=A0ABQ9HG42_9NEOP|nr:hypothetical protein PR048_015148 [Dryococelus australis]
MSSDYEVMVANAGKHVYQFGHVNSDKAVLVASRYSSMWVGVVPQVAKAFLCNRGFVCKHYKSQEITINCTLPPAVHEGDTLRFIHSPREGSWTYTFRGRLACSPPTKANRVQFPADSPSDVRMWASCRTITLVGGISRSSPIYPALSFRRSFVLTSITLISSHDLAVTCYHTYFTPSAGTPLNSSGSAKARRTMAPLANRFGDRGILIRTVVTNTKELLRVNFAEALTSDQEIPGHHNRNNDNRNVIRTRILLEEFSGCDQYATSLVFSKELYRAKAAEVSPDKPVRVVCRMIRSAGIQRTKEEEILGEVVRMDHSTTEKSPSWRYW